MMMPSSMPLFYGQHPLVGATQVPHQQQAQQQQQQAQVQPQSCKHPSSVQHGVVFEANFPEQVEQEIDSLCPFDLPAQGHDDADCFTFLDTSEAEKP
jgi:hypothetical protein